MSTKITVTEIDDDNNEITTIDKVCTDSPFDVPIILYQGHQFKDFIYNSRTHLFKHKGNEISWKSTKSNRNDKNYEYQTVNITDGTGKCHRIYRKKFEDFVFNNLVNTQGEFFGKVDKKKEQLKRLAELEEEVKRIKESLKMFDVGGNNNNKEIIKSECKVEEVEDEGVKIQKELEKEQQENEQYEEEDEEEYKYDDEDDDSDILLRPNANDLIYIRPFLMRFLSI
jgi:hypothetical protein